MNKLRRMLQSTIWDFYQVSISLTVKYVEVV